MKLSPVNVRRIVQTKTTSMETFTQRIRTKKQKFTAADVCHPIFPHTFTSLSKTQEDVVEVEKKENVGNSYKSGVNVT